MGPMSVELDVELDKKPEPVVKIFVLPGGRLPKRQTEGAIGYDVYVRAVVSPREMDPRDSCLRLTLFDFLTTPVDPEVAKHIVQVNDKLAYRLDPRESALVGIGFITEMPYPLFYWVTPRSGLASKDRITVTNAPGTVDPDYRGEAGVLVYNGGTDPFYLEHEMRIAQIVFQWAVIPEVTPVQVFEELGETKRGADGFGSTGMRGLVPSDSYSEHFLFWQSRRLVVRDPDPEKAVYPRFEEVETL